MMEGLRLNLRFIGANASPLLEPFEECGGKQHRLIGSDSANWRTNLSAYRKLAYRRLWPGIDVVFYGEKERLKYDCIMQPGANLQDAEFEYEGASGLELDNEGNLIIHTAAGSLLEEIPLSYQEIDGLRKDIRCRYRIIDAARNRFGYEIASVFDPRLPLIIDPMLLYSTLVGPSGVGVQTFINAVTSDAQGNAYVTGSTNSPSFIVTPGAFQTTFGGFTDAFVIKLPPSGDPYVYSTFIGGGHSDNGIAIAVDAEGNAYVTGVTTSLNFPLPTGALQLTDGGQSKVFVVKLNASGSELMYTALLSGSTSSTPTGLALDSSGNAYISGYTSAANFPTTPGALRPQYNGASVDAFVAKLNATGSALVYSTFLGGSSNNIANGIAVGPQGDAYIGGNTLSADFPTTAGAFTVPVSNQTGFVSRLNPDGTQLILSALLGGSDDDNIQGIALDHLGNIYVTGTTYSANYPTSRSRLRQRA
nr:SBBP repeat-containing protein [Paenibacillus sp. MMS18-CY102]